MDLVDDTATTSMEVGWYQKMSGVKHTGIVVVIDGEPRYTIDFEGNVNVHEWEDRNRRIHGMFIRLRFKPEIMHELQPNQNTTQGRNAKAKHFMSIVVKSKANKDKANNILKDIRKIKMGEYHAMKNNCRDHVVRVYDMLVKKWEVDSDSFHMKMEEIRDEDDKTVKAFVEDASLIYGKIAEVWGRVDVPLAAKTRFIFCFAALWMLDVVSKSAMAFGKKIQGCDVSNSNDNASPEEYSTYFQQVHGSSCRDGYDGYDYDDDRTHFFIIPSNIGINNENVEEVLHDMLMMGMALSITSVLDIYIDEVYKNEIIGCRYCLVLRQVFKNFG